MADWQSISKMPWQKVCWVKNDLMKDPILATRGFSDERGVHPDRTFCTSVFTPQEFGAFPSGKLVCPTAWKAKQVRPGESMEGPAEIIARAIEICAPDLVEKK